MYGNGLVAEMVGRQRYAEDLARADRNLLLRQLAATADPAGPGGPQLAVGALVAAMATVMRLLGL
jgi:hypothetical protein